MLPKKKECNRPLEIIEWVIASFTLIGGIYLFSPIYQISLRQNGLSAVAAAMNHPYVVLFWAAVLIVGAFFVLVGLWRDIPQFKSIGWFSIILARLFQILTTILVIGILPITWIYPLTITCVIVVLWVVARLEVRRRV